MRIFEEAFLHEDPQDMISVFNQPENKILINVTVKDKIRQKLGDKLIQMCQGTIGLMKEWQLIRALDEVKKIKNFLDHEELIEYIPDIAKTKYKIDILDKLYDIVQCSKMVIKKYFYANDIEQQNLYIPPTEKLKSDYDLEVAQKNLPLDISSIK